MTKEKLIKEAREYLNAGAYSERAGDVIEALTDALEDAMAEKEEALAELNAICSLG